MNKFNVVFEGINVFTDEYTSKPRSSSRVTLLSKVRQVHALAQLGERFILDKVVLVS